MIFTDPHNPRAQKLYEQICQICPPGLLEQLPVSPVIGGDGWMLNCIRNHGSQYTYLGLNAGTVGFLLNDINNIDDLITQLTKLKWRSFAFPRLLIEGSSSTGNHFSAKALNDVYVFRHSGRISNLRVTIDDVTVVERMACDGMIVSTSLGTTAYTFSAGGSPTHPLVRAIHVTPICPHTPRLSSFVVPPNSRISIQALHSDRRPVQAVSDGVSHGEMQHLTVSLDPKDINIAFLEHHNFTETMIRKVLRT